MSDQSVVQTVCPHCKAVNRVALARLTEEPNCGRCHNALFTGLPQDLDDAAFSRMLQKEQLPVVVDFWAAWCGPCKSFAPVFTETARAYRHRARFVKINTEQAVATAQAFQVRSIPTLMIFRNGQLQTQQSGALPANSFRQWLDASGV